ncbi:MAG TPA: hypothetical protein DCL15_19785 [Chloroflexi bacterium]|nr:hypothetical protein [Chloroflexota bacterium]
MDLHVIQELNHQLQILWRGELLAAVPCAVDQRVGCAVSAQRVGQVLPLHRRHVAVCRAMLDEEGGIGVVDVVHGVGRRHHVRHGLDRRTDQHRFGRIGGVVGLRAASVGELGVHRQAVDGAEPVHDRLHTA